ncbi:replication protein A 70 kDa DNA-binding subunit B, partial [Tanacetum coccineum]
MKEQTITPINKISPMIDNMAIKGRKHIALFMQQYTSYNMKMVGLIPDAKHAIQRFKIIVRIFDETGTAQVVIFDNNVYKMTKLSAWEIMEKQGMDADRYFPDDLNQIIGKQYLFKVKYSEFNHNNNSHVYRAEKVTEDVETINYFKNGFFDDE